MVIMQNYAQNNNLENNTFISTPDADTYSLRETWSFKNEKLTRHFFDNQEDLVYNYKIENQELMVNDSTSLGKIKFYTDYFKLYDKDGYAFQYTKLITTQITCSEEELKVISESSNWKTSSENDKSILKIRKHSPKKTLGINYKLIKLKNTYIIYMDELWNFTIGKISKDTIELYGMAKSNNLPSIVKLLRIKSSEN